MRTDLIQTVLEPWLLFLADDPTLRLLQGCMLLVGVLVIFMVFFVTRDILLRTHSFLYMFVSILLVAVLPVVGFFLYLLIRPPRTIKEREIETMLLSLTKSRKSEKKEKKAEKKKDSK